MRVLSRSWNTGPALYPPCRVLEGLLGVCPTSPHVLCGSGEGIQPLRPSWYSVGKACVARGRMESSLGATGFHLCFLQMMLSCWLHLTRTFSLYWSDLQPSVKRLLDENQHLQVRGHGSQPEKGGLPSSGLVERSCLQVEDFKYLRVLFMSEGKDGA
ncbi:hypothetical protein L3Q82_011962 [Scortum barcoo]|uniref:Uncharacterized protein n=1 Tax=Scortum barcoo TaxID=214431 RepID=A0ACB8W6I6_9TELE|nr:hypothetical protein L3Q82_011962 [Scortum barcoo]